MKITFKTTALAILVSLGITACGSSNKINNIVEGKNDPLLSKHKESDKDKKDQEPEYANIQHAPAVWHRLDDEDGKKVIPVPEKDTKKVSPILGTKVTPTPEDASPAPNTKPNMPYDSMTLNYKTDITLPKGEKFESGVINVILGKNADDPLFSKLLEKGKDGKSILSDKFIKFDTEGKYDVSYDDYKELGTSKSYSVSRNNLDYSTIFEVTVEDGTERKGMVGYAGTPTKSEIMKDLTGKVHYVNKNADGFILEEASAPKSQWIEGYKLSSSKTAGLETEIDVDFDKKTFIGNITASSTTNYVLKQGSISADNGEIIFSGKAEMTEPFTEVKFEGNYHGKFMGPKAEELAGKVSVAGHKATINTDYKKEIVFNAEKEQK